MLKFQRLLLATNLIFLLGIQLISFIPIERAYADDALIPITQDLQTSKTYAWKELGQQKQTTISLLAYTNGTVSFSKDSVESFKIKIPTGLAGSTTVLSNSTYVVIRVASNSFFIEQKWKLNTQKFKLELCWNLPIPTTARLPLNKASKFLNGKLNVAGLEFDWNDAIISGFNPSFENATTSIRVSIPVSGCLDPLVGTTSASADQILKRKSVQWFGNAWYVFFHSGTERVFRCSSAGGAFGASTSFSASTSEGPYSTYQNGTHIYISFQDWDWRILTPTSACGTTLSSEQSISTVSVGGGGIVQNNSGTLFLTGSNNINGVSMFTSNTRYGLGNAWTNRSIWHTPSASGTRLPHIVNMSDNNIMVYGSFIGSFQSRIWYRVNNSYGSLITVEAENTLRQSGNGEHVAVDCVSGQNRRVYCSYILSTGVLAYRYFDGSSWSARTNVANLGANYAFGITKKSALNDRILITRISGVNIAWNLTNGDGSVFQASGTRFIGSQTSPDFMSVSPLANGTNFIGVAWKNATLSPFNIQFDTFVFPTAFNRTITLNYFARDGTTSIQSLSPRCRLEANNGTVTFITGASGSCISSMLANQPIRVAMTLSANNSAFVKSSNTTSCCFNRWNFSIPVDTTYTVRTSVAVSTQLRFYADDGVVAPLRLNWIQIRWFHNSTVTNTTLTSTAQTFPLFPSTNSSNTIQKITAFSASTTSKNNIRPNATSINATSNSQALSIRTRVYQVDINGVRKDGVTTTYDNFMLRGTWPNGTSINSVNSTSQAISNIYLQNGTNTLTGWWVVSTRAVIVNNSFSYSFTSASTLNFILQLLEEASSGANFRWGVNQSVVTFQSWTAGNRTLRFNFSSTSQPQILLRFLIDTYKAAPDEVYHNGSLHNDPCCFEDNTRWFHNTNHANRFIYNSLVFRAPTPGAGPGPGGDAPAAGGGLTPAPAPVAITPEAAQAVQQLPTYAGLGTLAIVVLIVGVSLIGKAKDSRSISTMLRSSTKRPKFELKKEKVKR